MTYYEQNISTYYFNPRRALHVGYMGTRKASPRATGTACTIIQMAADGMHSQNIAQELGISRPTIQLWRQRFLALRLVGLEKERSRPGRFPKYRRGRFKRLSKPLSIQHHRTQPIGAPAAWPMLRGLARQRYARIWKQHNLKPHLIKTFKLSRDKHFVEKMYDVVGLYINPPDKSMVLCVDEKSQIQALDRTQPGLPMKKGRCGTMTHDYKRNGTTTLFAALSMLNGKVIGDCMPRHRHQEFIRFLKKIDSETPVGLRPAFDRGQLWYSQASPCKIMAQSTSTISSCILSRHQVLG